MPLTPNSGSIPDDRQYCPKYDLWAQDAADGEALIPECSGAVGAAVFVARALEPAWRTLVF
jgi:hypothetical protein